MKLKALIFLASIALISCKNEKSVEELPVVEEQPKVSEVNLVLDMVVPKDDVFQVFYTEDGTANCSEENSVKVNVTGKPESQKITFEFPENKQINYLRIDIGENPKQGELKFNNFLFTNFGATIEFKGNQIFEYFFPNDQFNLNFESSTLSPSNKKGNYDPIMYGSEQLIEKMNAILK